MKPEEMVGKHKFENVVPGRAVDAQARVLEQERFRRAW